MKETTELKTFSRPFTRRDFLSTSLKASAAALTTGLLPKHLASGEEHYNVLLIMVDDLRPLLCFYGHQEMHTPNIDRIAQRGTLFDHAYCQYPLCSPSPTSIITGLRPQTTGVLNNRDYFRETVPQVITLSQHFKSHGYYTQSVGRIFHTPDFQDDENSWSAPSWRPPWYPLDYETTPSWKALDVEDDDLKDGQVAKRAVEVLEQIKNQQFFLAVGFFKPHLPYNAPKKYFELYKNKTFNLPALSGELPSDIMPPTWNEIRPFADIPPDYTSLSYEKILELTRAYAAATSYTDTQIGRVLDQLDSLGLTEKTVIAFCGDHGYNLGEDGTWGKNIIVETALRSPMIVSVPGQAAPGEKTEALVELVDIYPTLCDACHLPILPELEGLSMLPVIQEPTLAWKNGVFSQLKQGHSIRTERYRYTEWGQLRELYDFNIDPYSDYNIVNLPENAELVARLSEQLKAGWRGALPDIHDHPNVPLNKRLDINSDGVVDIQDLILISNNFGKSSLENPKVDVNKDGKVNIIDLLIVAAHFTETTNPAAPTTHINTN